MFNFSEICGEQEGICRISPCFISDNAQQSCSMAANEPSCPETKRILIVEDNELNMKLLHDVLEAHGHHIIASREGGTAHPLARQYRPHLILLDIQLPDISGLEAARRLKEDEATRDIPIIAVTAFAMAGDERRTLESGCDAYIAKPIRLREFLDTVESFIRLPQRS
jgi:two-component system, cell cycle response regulator DivK